MIPFSFSLNLLHNYTFKIRPIWCLLQESSRSRHELPGLSPCLRSEKAHVTQINYIKS